MSSRPILASAFPVVSSRPQQARPAFHGSDSEYGVLEEVLLASPQHLSIVPCNEVSRDSLLAGLSSCGVRASKQHRALVDVLSAAGARVRTVQPVAGLPDLAFTRDTSLMTPWGLIGMRPGASHRREEVDLVLETARAAGIPVLGRVEEGAIEGGDVCLLRPGHLVIGVSEERTTTAGARALAAFFEARGWTVTTTPVDPALLHLDTHFCIADRDLALACVEKLEPAFLSMLEELGVELLPMDAAAVSSLGCNVLALGKRRVVSTGSAPQIDQALRERGYEVHAVALDEFTRCGGGVHCLTMPLRRSPPTA